MQPANPLAVRASKSRFRLTPVGTGYAWVADSAQCVFASGDSGEVGDAAGVPPQAVTTAHIAATSNPDSTGFAIVIP